MAEVAYLSATGEVKIPLKVRTKLGLQPGEKFNVGMRGRRLVLEPLGLPSVEQIREFVALTPRKRKILATRQATAAGGAKNGAKARRTKTRRRRRA